MKKIVVVGSLNQDCVVHADHAARAGETILTSDTAYFSGGKGANQAYAIAKLGGNVKMLGAVGDDDAGRFLTDNLNRVGVDTGSLLKSAEAGTGVAWIVVDKSGNNSISVLPGANRQVTSSYIAANRKVLEWADLVVMQLEIPLETVSFTAKTAKEMGKTVILDPAPAVADLPAEFFKNIDFIKPNETELSILTQSPTQDRNYGRKADLLQKKGVKTIIVSLGGEGVFAKLPGGETIKLSCIPVPVVDTTAAGDSFLAAFTVQLAKGKTFSEALKYAMKVSTIVVTRPGAQPSIPPAEEVDVLYHSLQTGN